MKSIIKFVILDILRSKIVLIYTILLAALSWSAFTLEGNPQKGALTLLNIILLIVPLVSILFTSIYLYNSSEFIELLVSQPLKRPKIWNSLFLGISLSLLLAFLLAVAVPLLLYTAINLALMMLLVGCFISVICVALACLSTTFTREKAKGIGIVIILWLFFALLFDAIVLFLLFEFADYPLEKIMPLIAVFNPLDMGRILILLHLDVSAMMGYTGAVFRKFLGNDMGMLVAFLVLSLWVLLPFVISLKKFKIKDL